MGETTVSELLARSMVPGESLGLSSRGGRDKINIVNKVYQDTDLLSIYLSTDLSIYLSIYPYIYLYIYLYIYISIYLSIYLSIYVSIKHTTAGWGGQYCHNHILNQMTCDREILTPGLYVCLSTLSVCLSVYTRCLFICLYLQVPVYLSITDVQLSVCTRFLFICLYKASYYLSILGVYLSVYTRCLFVCLYQVSVCLSIQCVYKSVYSTYTTVITRKQEDIIENSNDVVTKQIILLNTY